MQCTRCQGMLVADYSFDHLDATNPDRIQTWRCVMCGDVVDPVILHNRRKQAALKSTNPVTADVIVKSAA